MRFYLYSLLLLLCCSCNQVDPSLQTELQSVKDKLAAAELALTAAQKDETAFIHTVFFWAKEGTDGKRMQEFMSGLDELAKVPSIYKVYYGPPAMTPREVVDNSYDVAWVCHFKSKADQDAYQADPIHLKFIELYKDVWEKVQVYDNLIE